MKTTQTNTLAEKLFWFYRIGIRAIPIFLMISHWFGVHWFHHNAAPIGLDLNENAVLIVSVYALAYIVLPAVLLPASFLFGFSWVWRIPFIYLAGVILIRLGHGTLCISETTQIADYTLIVLTMLLYGRAFTLHDK
jgi:hypothetical protein|nr:MAG TPA: hypothetical protein [Caudoviricetes sp.]